MYLGSSAGGGIWLPVVNVLDDVIARGTVCSFVSDADRSYEAGTIDFGTVDRGQGAGVGPVHLIAVAPWVTSTYANSIGIANKSIAANEHGTITIAGPAICRTDGGVVAGESLEVTTGGILDTYAAGTKLGVALFTDYTDLDDYDYGSASNTYTLGLFDFMPLFTA